MSTQTRCELTELLVDQCAHCRNIPDPAATAKAKPVGRPKSLGLHVEDLMLIMNTNQVQTSRRRVGGTLPLRHFDKAEPFSLVNVTHADVADDAFFTDTTPWDLAAPLDVSIANKVTQGPMLYDEDFGIRRYRVIKRPYLPLQRLTRCIVESSYLAIDTRTGIARPSLKYYGINRPGDPWVELPPCGSITIGDPEVQDEEVVGLLSLACGVQFTRDYSWRVHLKYADAEIGVMIPTTPEGIRALFRLRDHEAGESRRKALIHWVSGHSRRINKDTDEEHLVWVRDHLRGAMSFCWQDMCGVIHPSGHDLRRLREMKTASRAARRARGRK